MAPSLIEETAETVGNRGGRDGQRTFDEFCRAEYPVLVGLLVLVLRDRPAAEDMAQETLARVWAGWGRVSSLDRPDLWARRVALNLSASWWRRERTARRHRETSGPLPTTLPAPPADDALLAAVRQLPPRQRAAVALRYFADLSVADAAAVMGCRAGTVKALTAQGVAALRQSKLITEDADGD